VIVSGIRDCARKSAARRPAPGRWSVPPGGFLRTDVLHDSGDLPTSGRASARARGLPSSPRARALVERVHASPGGPEPGAERPACSWPPGRPSRGAGSAPRGAGRGPVGQPADDTRKPPGASRTQAHRGLPTVGRGSVADAFRHTRPGVTAVPYWRGPPPSRTLPRAC
jgi:hypothetical protein